MRKYVFGTVICLENNGSLGKPNGRVFGTVFLESML